MTDTKVPATTDLSDDFPALVRHAASIFRDYGGRIAFCGPVATLKVPDDNSKVRETVESPGEGRVLVVDGGGAMTYALFGGNLGKLAEQNGWAGVVVHGCVRDTAELSACAIGIKALAAHPKRSDKRGLGEKDVEVSFAGITLKPGEWLYADADGIVVSAGKLG
ncbi:MAG: ribonuclease [Parvibaculum sp.]|jgi:regulator of ribonuclease activity A|uniref:ribonuclease E activity regulator RraA n=1 Tax=Parvibaculum sp. TaxID=2024848 RepID=UPI000C3C3449|nr:ribonuclease E activity regulator RraA [Parvibaculum sp.]MAU61957.1 ribonuclease [Parvibaculum sp.]|tara:strand:- start:2480 stop:2971 length:492 start_codon:yes stop_codon:yes gene_type:complete